MTQKMTPRWVLPAMFLVVLVLWKAKLAETLTSLDSGLQRDPELVALDERCLSEVNKASILPHPGWCHMYFNCSDDKPASWPWFFTPHCRECPYPQLFSTVTNKCETFDDVSCGQRKVLLTHCEYFVELCPGPMCRHCNEWFPSCKGLPDGVNPFQGVSPYYSVCRKERTVAFGSCPNHTELNTAQLVHPVKRQCVSVYEISKQDGGLGLSCTGKVDGLHLDDVTNRPDVHFRCFEEKLMEVRRCDSGQYFDQVTTECTATPLYNRIITADKLYPMWI